MTALETWALLMTDVEGSTTRWQDEPAVMDAAMRLHHRLVHRATAEAGGWRPVDQGEGDAVLAAFPTASAALAAAADAQRSLAAYVHLALLADQQAAKAELRAT